MLFSITPAFAQSGANSSFSPYSIYGIGDLYTQGTAHSRSMGGVGIASRDVRHINLLNPAAVSARDTLSILADIGLANDNRIYKQGDLKSANNTLNINNFAFSFPIWNKTAMLLYLAPFSSVGYYYSYTVNDPSLIGKTGFINNYSSGSGSIYQLSAALGTELWKRLSVGVQLNYYFGNLTKANYLYFNETDFRSITSGYTLSMRAVGAKVGVQYEQPIGDKKLIIGATYRTKAKMKGYITDFQYGSISSLTDTLKNVIDTVGTSRGLNIPSEIGIGISFKKPDKWALEFNYTRSDWSNSNYDNVAGFSNSSTVKFSSTSTQSFRAGFEYIPNRNDVRYYLRNCTYRVGTYYDTAYYKLDGNKINSYGVTFGVTFPVYRWYNGLTVGVDLGKRGSKTGVMTEETYAGIFVGFNIHDLWFIKHRYE